MTVTIRPPGPADRPAWEALYQGYAQFYGVPQTAQMRAHVWDWLMDPAHEVQGRVAVMPDGRLAGLAHFRPFARPLAASTGGFLDDLFVDPQARGAGVATAMIEALTVEARARGWSVLRWITAHDNDTAMSVCDRVADRTAWVTYDLKP